MHGEGGEDVERCIYYGASMVGGAIKSDGRVESLANEMVGRELCR